ncbi:MAG: hypothetical protein Q7W45_07230 [Bacteroidota bacterium]|nr:hypothetical protein [Bacteroidota bacterium]MDP3143933.1 hypothetical protein [Bacteroidota bacterium]MDP3557568.1 hypothetical protein [Bacteroidota bacterium]
MKKIILILITTISFSSFAQNVAINGTGAAPVASAMLDIASTNSGFLTPRMTSAQRTAIAAPATGLLVYDTTLSAFLYFDGAIWRLMAYSGGWLLAGNTLVGTEFMGSINAQPVRFFSTNAERMRIIPTGEVVINSTTANAGDLFSVYSSNASWPINSYVTGAGNVSAGYFANTSSSTGAIGVLGTVAGGAGTAGVRGTGNTANGNGVTGVGQSATAFGLRGHNTDVNGTGAVISGDGAGATYLVTGGGAAITGADVGVWGRVTSATGTGGYFSGNAQGATNLVGGSGLSAVGTNFGVVGFSNSVVNGVLRAGGYFDTGSGQSFAYVGARTAANVVRKIEGNGTVNTVVKDLNNKQVVLSAPEAPENLFQDFGQGQLVNGKVHITIDPIFSKNIIVNQKHPLRVFVQLQGDCNGVFVSNETGTGFDVTELKSGSSNTKFTYFITANRADEILSDGSVSKYSEERFAPSMGAQKTEQKESKELNDNLEVDIKKTKDK